MTQAELKQYDAIESQRAIPGALGRYDRDEIKAAHAAGISVKQLAREYKRTAPTIQKILAR